MNKKLIVFVAKIAGRIEIICEYLLLRYYYIGTHLKSVRKVWFLYLFFLLVAFPFILPVKILFDTCGGSVLNVLYHVRELSINKEFVIEVDNMIDEYC